MKKKSLILILSLFITLPYVLMAQQGVAINTTGAPPDGSAMLDVSSTGKGILIPRMNNGQMTGMLNPANGLLVYNTEYNCFYHYWTSGGSSGWRKLITDAGNSTLYDVDFDTYLTLNYEGSDDDTLRIFFNDD